MKPGYHAVNAIIRAVFSAVCRVDARQLERIPGQGPAIVVANHINFLESPVMVAWLDNPAVTGIAKRESWKNPLFYFLFNLWEIIPIDRGLVDREAFNRAQEALQNGKLLVVTGKGFKEAHVKRVVDLSAEKYCSASIMLGRAGVDITHDYQIVEID